MLNWDEYESEAPVNTKKLTSNNLEKNYITKFIDLNYLSMDDTTSPKFFDLVKIKVSEEINNRPKGNLVSIQSEDGQIRFVKPLLINKKS